MRRALSRFWRDAGGVAAIEAALVLPILLALIGGIFEYSRVLLAQHMIRDLIDETVRSAAVTGLSDTQVRSDIDDGLDEVPGVDTYTVSAQTTAGTLSVSVSCNFRLFFGELLPDEMIAFEITVQYPVS